MKEAFEKLKERLEKKISNAMHNFTLFTDTGHERLASVCEVTANAYTDALSIVSEVEAEFGKDINVRSNGWIDVKDRLPENDDDVLVWYRYRMMQGVNIVGSKEMHGIGHYYEPADSWLIYGGFGLDQNVIAWMPLPELYKPEKGGQ